MNARKRAPIKGATDLLNILEGRRALLWLVLSGFCFLYSGGLFLVYWCYRKMIFVLLFDGQVDLGCVF